MQRLPLTALAEQIANGELPAGLELVTTIGDQRIYCAHWTLTATGDQVDYLGDDSVLYQIEQVAAIEAELQKLLAEKEALLQVFNLSSPAPVASDSKIGQQVEQVETKADNKPLVWCQVDGCDIWMGMGASIAKHRHLMHKEWFKRQQALAADHPLKVSRTDAIDVIEATKTDNLPPVAAAHEVADEEIPFSQALAV